MTTAACAPNDHFESAARELRHPLGQSTEPVALLREIVRCAILAPNGHNTQPWMFALSPDLISIRPDFSRRTPVVDPDDHHVWVSLGCAAENIVIAAAALGKHADVQVDSHEIRVSFDSGPPATSPLVEAIFQRQCTRAEYDGQPLANDILRDLERAADRSGVRVILLTERAKIEGVIEYVTQANSAQMRDPAFISELKHWIRFDDSQAIASGDGLAARSSGTPTSPPWVGGALFSWFFREKSENDRYAKQLRSSAAVAVFIGARSDPASWFEVGRAYEHFALAATALGIRTAFVNQPIEVPAVRSSFSGWLGTGTQRPDLVVRLGRGPQLPYSLRRPVAAVIG
ncbi:MAG: nitroreductase family protein [Pseudomonadota bacterium]|nr:nitroreductase family protein [Pseudomonadota bacterium]